MYHVKTISDRHAKLGHNYKYTKGIKYFIIQLMCNVKYVDTIKKIKYLKVLQHVSDHKGSIIREP